MANITLRTVVTPSGGRAIEATTGTKGTGGSANVPPKASIKWTAGASGEIFRVFFFDLANPAAALWPFKQNGPNSAAPDGHDSLNRPYLLVNDQAKHRKLDKAAPSDVLYKVEAENPQNTDPLDPVIIIRPKSSSSSVIGASLFAAGLALGWLGSEIMQ